MKSNYTVRDLIETLKDCPQDYPIEINVGGMFIGGINMVGIDHNGETVDLFLQDSSQ